MQHIRILVLAVSEIFLDRPLGDNTQLADDGNAGSGDSGLSHSCHSSVVHCLQESFLNYIINIFPESLVCDLFLL